MSTLDSWDVTINASPQDCMPSPTTAHAVTSTAFQSTATLARSQASEQPQDEASIGIAIDGEDVIFEDIPQNTSKGKSEATRKRGRSSEDGPPKKKVRKPLVAKKVEWDDIPDWNGREDCPLLELPGEILDLCFGLGINLGLTMRDYVSLAGVSRLFRTRMTNTVFHELCTAPTTSTRIYGVPVPKTNHAHRIFTKTLEEDWRLPKKKPISYPSRPDHYTPRGPRSQWSEAQYIVYREERYFWRAKYRSMFKSNEDRKKQDGNSRKEHPEKTVHVGGMSRTIIGRVRGRESGAPPVEKDANGIPKEVYQLDIYKQLDVDNQNRSNNRNQNLNKISAIPLHVRKRIEKRVKDVKSKTIGGVWETPSLASDKADDQDEEDRDEDEDEDDAVKPKFWPSEYRQRAVNEAHSQFIGKSDAMREFKVTEAELLCLKHILVPNPMNKSSPQQVFWYSAVEALAYRSHGGPIGHREFMKRANEIMEKSNNTRRKNIEKAKEVGTYIEKKRKHRLLPSEWKEQQAEAMRQPSNSSTPTANSSSGSQNGRTEEPGTSSKSAEEEETHQFCKEGCTCQKDPFKRHNIPDTKQNERDNHGSDDDSEDDEDDD